MIQPEVLRDYIARYRHKASVLTRIHSALANRNNFFDLGHTCAIVLLTGMITFLGFIGTDRILDAIGGDRSLVQLPTHASAPASASSTTVTSATPSQILSIARRASFDFYFNVGVLLLFVASLLNLIFRWKERYTAHFQGVVKLKQFVGWLDEIALLGASAVEVGKLKHIRHRYESIVELLPPNSDSDYARAKEKMAMEPKSASLPSSTSCATLPPEEHALVLRLVKCSPAIMEVLTVASKVSSELWLGGGSVRTTVWDYLTSRSTKGHDFDIVYFDAVNIGEEQEKLLEKKLREFLPRSFIISVKNQARMHLVNGEPRRESLKDAISNWPERATAMAVRLTADGQLELFTPYGCDDMLDMLVRPTPYHEKNPSAFNRRLLTKAWQTHWPEVEVHHPK